jgi:hypothetical protein
MGEVPLSKAGSPPAFFQQSQRASASTGGSLRAPTRLTFVKARAPHGAGSFALLTMNRLSVRRHHSLRAPTRVMRTAQNQVVEASEPARLAARRELDLRRSAPNANE